MIHEADAHGADERLPLSDLYKATEVVAFTQLRTPQGWHSARSTVEP